jgi:DNA-binding transcriptional MerR regulator
MNAAQTQVTAAAKYKLAALCEMTGFTPRQVHELSHRGALPPPVGHARSAHYTDEHVDLLRKVRQWTVSGISVTRIVEHIRSSSTPPSSYPLDPDAVVTERWTRARIGQMVEIAVVMGGSEEQTNRELLGHLVEQAKVFLNGKRKVAAPATKRTERSRPTKSSPSAAR